MRRKRLMICRECYEARPRWLVKEGVCWYCRSFWGQLVAFLGSLFCI